MKIMDKLKDSWGYRQWSVQGMASAILHYLSIDICSEGRYTESSLVSTLDNIVTMTIIITTNTILSTTSTWPVRLTHRQ